MSETGRTPPRAPTPDDGYRLDEQVGFVLRQVTQRHTAIFAERMAEGLTPTQFAVLAKLHEAGASPQNALGRQTAMDAATVKGVVDRLARRGLVVHRRDVSDGRRRVVDLTERGREVVAEALPRARRITEDTLGPLDPAERRQLLDLLKRLR